MTLNSGKKIIDYPSLAQGLLPLILPLFAVIEFRWVYLLLFK